MSCRWLHFCRCTPGTSFRSSSPSVDLSRACRVVGYTSVDVHLAPASGRLLLAWTSAGRVVSWVTFCRCTPGTSFRSSSPSVDLSRACRVVGYTSVDVHLAPASGRLLLAWTSAGRVVSWVTFCRCTPGTSFRSSSPSVDLSRACRVVGYILSMYTWHQLPVVF